METRDPSPHHAVMAFKSVKKADRRKTFIKAWRKYRGRTQAQVAEFLGLSVPQLSRIESGQQEYRQDLLELIAEYLQCAPADLLMRDPLQPQPLWSIWDQLAPTEREEVSRYAEFRKKAG